MMLIQMASFGTAFQVIYHLSCISRCLSDALEIVCLRSSNSLWCIWFVQPILSHSKSISFEMAKRPNLTLEQRVLIKVLYKDLGQDADQIREHESLARPDGTKILKKTVQHWIDRIDQIGVPEPKAKSGRKPLLDDTQVKKLDRLIAQNPKKRYNQIRSSGKFAGSRRTINRYANKLSYREYRE